MSLLKEEIFWQGDHILSPLGSGSSWNFQQVLEGQSAISRGIFPGLSSNTLAIAKIQDQQISGLELGFSSTSVAVLEEESLTRLERFFVHSLQTLIEKHQIPMDEKTLVILSSTKGNIDLMGHREDPAVYLSTMSARIAQKINAFNPIINVSNACISGSLAIAVAARLLQSDRYERALVTGGDELSRFVVSGFESFQALSDQPCKPFDRDRNGLNLGEAIATVYLTKDRNKAQAKIAGFGSYNDANHISGPSRTGEGLYRSITTAMEQAQHPQIDFISAHGTATPYNDEMESIALERSGLSGVPVNSLKAIFGHTLGASGLLESIITMHAAHSGYHLRSLGYTHPGTSQSLAVVENTVAAPIHSFLKLASGFGGCNIATVFNKII